MSKILILGAKGNLGMQLVKLFSVDCDVTAWDRNNIDITDKELITKKILDIKPKIIINAAAYNAVDKCEESEEELIKARKINAEAVGYLADACLLVGAKLVSYSTDYVFSGEQIEGYREEDKPSPINKYGKTKKQGEDEIISRSAKGLKYYIIRTSKLFGPNGESESVKPSFFDIMLNLSKTKDQIDVVDEEVSCFTYTPDLAKATKELIEADKGNGIYHIINSGAATWYEAAKELFIITNKKIKINPVSSDKFPRPAKRPKYSILLNTKLEPLRSYKQALKEYLINK